MKLGSGYKNDHACASFVEFIAREQQHILLIIKNNSRICLRENTLDQLIRINVEGPLCLNGMQAVH